MDKDFELKNDPTYQTTRLRERIDESIKKIRDEAEEVKKPQVKQLSNRRNLKRGKTSWNKNDI